MDSEDVVLVLTCLQTVVQIPALINIQLTQRNRSNRKNWDKPISNIGWLCGGIY